ncbi:DNA-binding transcriptional regulator, MocR family, contains an aminotransferase domain [Paenibacillus sp. yr247]|uniref:MocR-like pyridoxine biosynthesis transcription factor PdxR n=1 Tax=Paenibacillus sp. yr247 TaxID=1761880 RepID=UPI000884B5ED|nr:PLP-dependent aminotransferase family protein [Paenibacillus sp. yr247]SDO78645.1 DNA-binding transcriptional regulator, MocR family, contains an aminotransferase domain [Paenibacillus sp. yr247]
MWKPDRSIKKPIYQQIADFMERRISFGEFPPGSTLPSERKLADYLEVNRSTVVLAYAELRASGIVESAKGSGTRVTKHKWGIAPKQTPNWKTYVEGGTFLPNLPFIRRIREELRKGSGIIDFASGELSDDLFPNEIVRELLQKQPFQEQLGYDDPQGYSPLRETLVSFLEQHLHIHSTDSSILITSGSQQSLYLITQCLLSPGDAVAIEDPSYCYSLPMFQSAGLRLFRLPVDDRGINPEDIVTLHRQHRIRMLFLNPNFQNPTGSVIAPERRIRLLEIASELGIPIVEDDPFTLTALNGDPPPTLKSLDQTGNVLYIGSLSKIAASGLRIGWLIAPQAVVNRLTDARQQMDFGLSRIPQWVANQFIADGHCENQINLLRKGLLKKRNELMRGLQDIMSDYITYTPPKGGLNLWCKINREVDDFKLLDEAIKRGVLFVPGSVYGSDQDCIRISFARPRFEEIIPGLTHLYEALQIHCK